VKPENKPGNKPVTRDFHEHRNNKNSDPLTDCHDLRSVLIELYSNLQFDFEFSISSIFLGHKAPPFASGGSAAMGQRKSSLLSTTIPNCRRTARPVNDAKASARRLASSAGHDLSLAGLSALIAGAIQAGLTDRGPKRLRSKISAPGFD
jgi:hypothetical protein